MRRQVINDAMNLIEDDFILEALPSETAIAGKKYYPGSKIEKYLAIAACLVIMISVAPVAFRFGKMTFGEEKTAGATAAGGAYEETAPAEEAIAEEDGALAQAANPLTWQESLAEMNKVAGCEIKAVELGGVQDETYLTISGEYTLAEYCFNYMDNIYVVRAAKTQEDISGVYLEDGTLSDRIESKDGQRCNIGDYRVAIWFADDIQYCVYSEQASAEDFEAVLSALR